MARFWAGNEFSVEFRSGCNFILWASFIEFLQFISVYGCSAEIANLET
jgi:hypothetical protein